MPARSVNFVQNLRKQRLKKAPSIAETIDWARALLALEVDRPLFKRLFVSYFSPPGANSRPEERGGGEADGDEDIDIASEKTYAFDVVQSLMPSF